MNDDPRFDGLYLNVTQQSRGIEPMLDSVFGFLRRKTDFFAGPPGSGGDEGTQVAIDTVMRVVQKHADVYRKEKEAAAAKKTAKKKTKNTTAKSTPEKHTKTQQSGMKQAPPAKGDEEDVVEIGEDGGFDVSTAPTGAATSDTRPSPPAVPAAKPDGPPVIAGTKDEPTTMELDLPPPAETKKDGSSNEPPPLGNGGTVESKYVWTQTLEEVSVTIALPEGSRGRDVNVTMQKQLLKVGLKATREWIVNGRLVKPIVVDDSFWTVEDGNRLVLNLQKLNGMEWWNGVVEGDATIDVTKIQPESSNLSDLDGETRKTVEKMMFDQRQKARGLPTADEQAKLDMLEKFKAQHPELDFSNAKIN